MRGFTKAIVAGNVTRDPEMRTTPSGSQVCSFTIAVNRSFRGSDGNQQESVSYLDCVAWGKSGETINQYIHKGSALLVSGRLEQRSWDDKNTGQKRSRVEIVVDDFSFIGGDRSVPRRGPHLGRQDAKIQKRGIYARRRVQSAGSPCDN